MSLSSRRRNIDFFEDVGEIFLKGIEFDLMQRGLGHDHVVPEAKRRSYCPEKSAHTTFGPVADNGVANLFAGNESDFFFSLFGEVEEDAASRMSAFAASVDKLKFFVFFERHKAA